jgi:hypothetical protein
LHPTPLTIPPLLDFSLQAGHIAAIRRILGQSLPLSDAAALSSAKLLLERYRKALKVAEGVTLLSNQVGPLAVAEGNKCRVAAEAALERTTKQAAEMKAGMEQVSTFFDADGQSSVVAHRVKQVRQQVGSAFEDVRFAGLKVVTDLLDEAKTHAEHALKQAQSLAADLVSAQEAGEAFFSEHQRAKQTLAGDHTLSRDLRKLERLSAKLGDPKHLTLVAHQAALRLELGQVEAIKRKVTRTQAKVTPVLEGMRKRLDDFTKSTEVKLGTLASVAGQALLKVEAARTSVEKSLEEAESIVSKQPHGKCEVAWVNEEVKLLEGIAAEECRKAEAKAVAKQELKAASLRSQASDDVKDTNTTGLSPTTTVKKVEAAAAAGMATPGADVSPAAAAAAPAGTSSGGGDSVSLLTPKELQHIKAKFIEATQTQKADGQASAAAASLPASPPEGLIKKAVIDKAAFVWLVKRLNQSSSSSGKDNIGGPSSSSSSSSSSSPPVNVSPSSSSSPVRLLDPHAAISTQDLDSAFQMASTTTSTRSAEDEDEEKGGVSLSSFITLYSQVSC